MNRQNNRIELTPFLITVFVIAIAILLTALPIRCNAQVSRKILVVDETWMTIYNNSSVIEINSTNDEVARLIIKKYHNDTLSMFKSYHLVKQHNPKLGSYTNYRIYIDGACRQDILDYFKQLNFH